MFDIGFPELLLVSVIALIVIGPEKLPETIRTLSLWLGRLKRSLATIKSEIEAEIGADDIRRQLRDESVLQEIKDTKLQLEDIIDSTRNDLAAIGRSVTSKTQIDDADSRATESSAVENSTAGPANSTAASTDSQPEPNGDRSDQERGDTDQGRHGADQQSSGADPNGIRDDGRGG